MKSSKVSAQKADRPSSSYIMNSIRPPNVTGLLQIERGEMGAGSLGSGSGKLDMDLSVR